MLCSKLWQPTFSSFSPSLYLRIYLLSLFLALCLSLPHSDSSQYSYASTLPTSTNSTESLSGSFSKVKPKVWIASIVSILVISMVGLLGVAMVPLMLKVFYNHVIQFLVALAVGSLTGDAMLHLLPHAIVASLFHGQHNKHNHNDKSTVYKGLAALAGVYLFFMAEKLVVLVTEYRAEKKAAEEESAAKIHRLSITGNAGETTTEPPPSSAAASHPATQSTATPTLEPNNPAKLALQASRLRPTPDSEEFVAIGISGRAMRNIDDMIRRAGSERALFMGPHDEEQCTALVSDPRSPNMCPPHDSGIQSDALKSTDPPGLNNNHTVPFSDSNYENVPMQPLNPKSSYRSQTDSSIPEKIAPDSVVSFPHGDADVVVVPKKHSKESHSHGGHNHGHSHNIPGSMQAVVWMVILGDGLHNFSDGLAIGAAFAQSISGGVSTAVAVFCHELPHELGDFAALLSAGMPVRRAILYNILSSVLCFLGMLLGIALGNVEEVSYWIFAVAGGTFIYIALVDMLPELSRVERRQGESRLVHFLLHNAGILTGVGIMFVIAMYEDKIKFILDRDLE